ncbi:Crp/Fnr family transcriptional regulator [Pseudoalteromonas denitrificans]|uniref:Cyclic nucleotide-binding protein n=1 Tax=Pseudoalteromonas denitrificans DSM 6059 TaxID=1123010 RepID=A0A1I1J5K5_9GAMM|nr:Crp/Fnr family transcriptional regulator [Pseudoalteromonas denitrificans]SFC41888.1 cyclic nucleotide-binding protein [Pseudoalteromonas denitrificans DSM 6059]
MIPAFMHLQQTLNLYHILPDDAWQAYLACCTVKKVKKGEIIYFIGSMPTSFAFIHQGLMRAYVIDKNGNEYNKNFFAEGRFPGCMSALLNNKPSWMEVQALENSEIVIINHAQFRDALFNFPDLMKFQIHYLEAHWLLEKEPKEVSYLQFEAKTRYLRFLESYSAILTRLTQYHIASYLGITPTQLSRIKKEIKEK